MKNFFCSVKGVVAVLIVVCLGCWALYTPPKIPAGVKLQGKIRVLEGSDSRWDIKITPEQLAAMQEVLGQPLAYLAQGKQCHAYTSKDGQYVVKLLLQKPLRVRSWIVKLPDVFPLSLLREYKIGMRFKRKEALFSSFLLSYQVVPEETGTVFVHLNPTNKLFKEMLVIDRECNPCLVDFDTTHFIVQKKARLLKPVISQLMWEGKIDEAKARIDQVFMLLFDCAKKGVLDIDPGLIRNNNIGLLDTRAIYIDTGKLRYMPKIKEKKYFAKDLVRLRPLHNWLKRYFPELADHFVQKQKEVLQQF